MPMSSENLLYVLDSFAMLAFLGGETGMEQVKDVLRLAAENRCKVIMSLINLGEVLYITEREVGLAQAQAALAVIEQLPLELIPVMQKEVLAAAHLKANYRISYADAFAIATAVEYNGTILTGDPEFETVEKFVSVEWLKR